MWKPEKKSKKQIDKETSWISVNDELPEEGKLVLCSCCYYRDPIPGYDGTYSFVETGRYRIEGFFTNEEKTPGVIVTHWMPLPQPVKWDSMSDWCNDDNKHIKCVFEYLKHIGVKWRFLLFRE